MVMIDYKKYKWFYTHSGKLVVGGKSAESNDSLLLEMQATKKDYIVMHTKTPGSPFCVIVSDIADVTARDIEECAIFTGCFSRAWKSCAKNVEVDIFRLSQLSKNSLMKTGTWQVSGKISKKNVELELAIVFQEKIVRAVPIASADASDIIAYASPGNVDKIEAVAKTKIPALKKLNKEDLIAALPAGGVAFKK